MKRVISVIVSIALIFSFGINSFATGIKPSHDDLAVKAGDTFDIAYALTDNNGIMGFGFEIIYDSSAFEILKVNKSPSLIGGIFNDSVGTSTDGCVKIIWSSTENFYGNVDIFSVTVKVKETASGKYSINIKCLEDDTFDDSWNQVNINEKNVKVKVENENSLTIFEIILNFFKKIFNVLISAFN